MLMAEPGYRGQLNVPDMVTRLILSLAATGLAPESFYVPDADGGRARSHFDGLPVDFVAEAIATLGTSVEGFHTYNVVNPHDDGIGLDEYADWIGEAGYPLERIADHRHWFERFEMALQNLPEAQRKASILPIIDTQRHQLPPQRGTFAPADRFAAAVADAHVGGHGTIPGIDAAIIAKYLTDLESLGLLDPERNARSFADAHEA
jgi:fatty acid CoA ligase FadD9